MSSWESYVTISNLISLRDIENAASNPYATPVLGLVAESRVKGYDSICMPLTTDRWKERWTSMCLLPIGSHREKEVYIDAEKRAEEWRLKPAFTKGEVTVTRLDEIEGTTVLVSEWLELDASDDWIRHDAEIALQQELSYASYLNVNTAILPPPRNRANAASYGRIMNACLKKTPFIQLSVRLPIYDPSGLRPTVSPSQTTPRLIISEALSTTSPQNELNATWEIWDVIRSICDYNPRLTLTLDLTLPLPATHGALSRWAAEPLRYIILPSSTFIANSKGYPVLPKATQSFLRDMMAHRPTVILSGSAMGLHSKGGEQAYAQYVRHLEKTSYIVQSVKKPGTVEHFAQGYQDYLQAPLQPLMDNLASLTYQTFEQDPVKYRNYEEAIFLALMDLPPENRIVLCVAGAGRGPLVQQCLSALNRSMRQGHIYAVEKNPNAFVTLQSRLETDWDTNVELLFGDMRSIDLPEKVDILVSELLGSFGDNELSPECLDGAVRFLKADGISIPSSYTAFLAPISSSKLYDEARMGKDEKSVETPYVVMLQAINTLSGDGGGVSGRCGPQIQECWEFEHPRRDAVLDFKGLPATNSHNTRSASLIFHIPHAGILHGLAGYFEASLYKNVGLSIHPQRQGQISKDMLSWFPLFFPFKHPMYLPSNSELYVSIWRLTDQRKVWYEWHAELFLPTMNVPPDKESSYARSPGVASSPLFSPSMSISSIGTASPLIDAVDMPLITGNRSAPRRDSVEHLSPTFSLVKIAQTELHNPGGRSSWIGL